MGGFELRFQVEGSVLHDLYVRDFSLRTVRPNPFQSFTVKSLKAEYSLLKLLRQGPRSFIRTAEVQDMELILDPRIKRPANTTRKRPRQMLLSSILRDIAHPPILPTQRAVVRNFRLISHTPAGDFELLGASAMLEANKPGFVSIDRLHIPKVHTWEKISAKASYENASVTLRDIHLDPEMQIDRVRINAPKGTTTSMDADARTFGGRTSVALELDHPGKDKFRARISGQSKGGSLQAATRYFGGHWFGSVNHLKLDVQGDPNCPETWTGTITTELADFKIGLDYGLTRGEMTLKDGSIRLLADGNHAGNAINLDIRMALPETLQRFKTTPIRANAHLAATKIERIFPKVSGGLTATGALALADGVFSADLNGSTTEFSSPGLKLGQSTFTLGFAKKLIPHAPSDPPRSFFDNLEIKLSGQYGNLQVSHYASDSGLLNLSTKNRELLLDKLTLQRGDNAARLHGHVTFPLALGHLQEYDIDLRLAIAAPNLAALLVEPDLTALGGQLNGTAHLVHKKNSIAGEFDFKGADLAWQGFNARSLELAGAAAESLLQIQKGQLIVDDKNRAELSGQISLKKPLTYKLSMLGDLKDLSSFAPLLNTAGKPQELKGTLAFQWDGSAAPGEYHGNMSMEMRNAQIGNLRIAEASTSGTYSPDSAQFSELRIISDKTSVTGMLDVTESKLRLRELSVKQGNLEVLRGFIMAPMELRHLSTGKPLFPMEGGIAVNVNAENLNLGALCSTFGRTAPAEGVFSANLVAGGSLAAPKATLRVAGRGIKSAKTPKLSPAELEAKVHYGENQLSIEATARQPEIDRVQLQGSIPLDLRQVLEHARLAPETPIEMKLSLPGTNAAFLSKVMPAIRFVQGTINGSLNLGGTIGEPVLNGALQANIPAIRFYKTETPPINGLIGELNFAKDRLTINRLRADMGGGEISATGEVRFASLAEPILDVSLRSSSALLVRNDTLTLRADSKLKLEGPLNQARISGEIGITKSRFFREIDLLPIQLPGRPAPKPRATQSGFSFEQAPLRDWAFDVKIKTKDPFAVRGNLTNGSVRADLKLIGTGLAPSMEGNLRFEDLSASLPFSRLDVASGYVYFTAESPFIPKLDIRGTSELRNYNISVYIYGTASEPVTLFTSEPPLPQEEIIALLATGSTTEELTSNPNAVAGRAAALVFQKMYRKFFKQSGQESTKESIVNRFQLEVGGVDPRTGLQELQGSFKLADRFYLVGDLDVQGNARGQVRYLLRFR